MPIMPLAFFFATPWAALAAAGAAVSIPVVIHLLSRKRYRVVTWAAMRFLLAAQKQSARRLRLEQFLLLGTRCLLLLLLALAMASVMPWAEAFWYRLFPDSAVLAAAGSQRTHKILVLDGSLSMALKGDDATSFERGKRCCSRIIDGSSGSDGFSVVLMTAPPRRVVGEPSDDARRVAQELQALRLPHGNADFPATLQVVDDMLLHSPDKYEAREVYFVTDLQKSTWTASMSAGLTESLRQVQDRARVVFVDVGQDNAANVAVTDLSLGAPFATTGGETPFLASLHNYGSEPRSSRVELLVGRARDKAVDPPFEMRVVRQETASLAAGSAGTVTLTHKFTTAGDYAVQVRVEGDALEPDDTRSLVVTVKETVPVMLVNGKPAPRLYDRATEYLFDALNPFDKAATPRNVPPRPTTLTEAQFADAALGDLAPFDCVFLCDVARVSAAEARRLDAHLQRGGGVVFCLGPRVDIEAYNRVLFREGLLPGRLLGVERAAEDRPFSFQAEDAVFKRAPLDAFAGDDDRASLMRVRLRQYVRCEVPERGKARTLLTFARERGKGEEKEGLLTDPAVVEMPRHRGRVVLLTSTANMDWTGWPGSPSYPAFMQEVLRFAVAGRLHGQGSLVGDTLEETLPPGSGGVDAAVQTPDGRAMTARTLARDDSALFRFTDTDQSGIYRMTLGQHPREYLFAVNVPVATEGHEACESNLTRHSADSLRAAYPGWEVQVVADPKNVVRVAASGSEAPRVLRGMGAIVARWLLLGLFMLLLSEGLLAWKLGHYSKTSAANEAPPAAPRKATLAVGLTASALFVALTAVLLHTAWTRDFLGFLPDGFRAVAEAWLGVPRLATGESTRWRLEYTPYLPISAALEPWLIGGIAALAIALVVGVYLREGRTASQAFRLLLAGLRVFLVLLLLAVLLPQLQLWFERQGWPDLAVIVDDSRSMGAADHYRDPRVQEAAERLGQMTTLSAPHRLALAQALLTHPDSDWLGQMVARRKMKVHVYHCSAETARLADFTRADQRDSVATAVAALQANGDASHLGGAVRKVLEEFRGSSLAGIVMLTDGVTTEGEDLVQASRHAAQAGVPLFFVGLGDAHETRDLQLHDLQVEDTVFVNDRLVFEAKLTAKGFTNLPPLTLTLKEKGRGGKPDIVLASEKVTPDLQGRPVKFRVVHQPKEPGEKVYVLEIAAPPEKVAPNRLERTILVREAKPSRVLYVEGYPRPEFRFLKALLERESANDKGNKTIDLKVLLLDAADDWHLQDKSARPDFPTKEELNQFDAVILGDVDPKHPKMGDKNLKLLVDFTRERGGGLLLIAGKRDNPRSYRDTPLADVLPIQVTARAAVEDPDAPRAEGYRPRLTPLGRMHPIFRFSPDEAENAAIWERLAEMYWYADGYRPQPAAEVLAVHPKQPALDAKPGLADERHPLVVQHFVGNGRCLLLGFDETWAWGFREDNLRHSQFWIQMVNYLARNRLGRTDLRLDRQTPYRRGEPIRVTVRFPDDAQPPSDKTEVKVLVERRPRKDAPGEIEKQTLQLARVEGSRATYETLLTRTPEGEYTFTLAAPLVAAPMPRAEAKVLAPPGEMERLRMNQTDMERAAEETHGHFYNLADAERIWDDLPGGTRVALSTPGPPWLLWNHSGFFLLAAGLLAAEWALRKRMHLL